MSVSEWLFTPEADAAIRSARNQLETDNNILRIVKQLRKEFRAEQVALAMEQAQIQIRAKIKFRQAHQMFFTRLGYEQATSEAIARYKASCFSSQSPVADICCGIGGDAIGLAERCQVLAVDSQPIMARLTHHNARQYPIKELNVEVAQFPDLDLSQFQQLHFDPDRRVAGRTTVANEFSPTLEKILSSVGSRMAAVKLAPATNLPQELRERVHREWIGEHREAKQQVMWLNHPEKAPGYSSCTVITGNDQTKLMFENESQFKSTPIAKSVGGYVFEPHATVIAGRMVNGLARQFGLARLGKGVAYLTGNFQVPTALVSAFRVDETVPLRLDHITQYIRKKGYGIIEWKKRVVEQETFEQLRKIRCKGDLMITAIVSPSAKGPVVVFCNRLDRQGVVSRKTDPEDSA